MFTPWGPSFWPRPCKWPPVAPNLHYRWSSAGGPASVLGGWPLCPLVAPKPEAACPSAAHHLPTCPVGALWTEWAGASYF